MGRLLAWLALRSLLLFVEVATRPLYPCCPRRICRSADGRVFHVGRAGHAGVPTLDTRGTGDALLALLLAIACPFIKTPGVVWLSTLVPAIFVALVPRHGITVVAAGFALGIAGLAILAQTSPLILSYQLYPDFAPAWGALLESFFMLGNWNLLWYGVIAATILAGPRLASAPLAPFATIIVGGVSFLFVVFGFTNAREWVETQTTIDRAVLHLAPLAAVWMLVAFRAWAMRNRTMTSAVATV